MTVVSGAVAPRPIRLMLHRSDLEDDIAAYIRDRLPHAAMDVVFDVGANVGWVTIQFLQSYPDVRAWAFEPVPSIYDRMAWNLGRFPELDHARRVQCVQAALGAEPGSAFITNVPEVTTNKIVTTQDQTDVLEIQVLTGDEFCRERGIEHINYLKVDAEGYDLKVLFGFLGMLSKGAVDFIQVEASMSHENSLHEHVDSFKAFLRSFGYELFRVINQASFEIPYLTRADVVFIRREAAIEYAQAHA